MLLLCRSYHLGSRSQHVKPLLRCQALNLHQSWSLVCWCVLLHRLYGSLVPKFDLAQVLVVLILYRPKIEKKGSLNIVRPAVALLIPLVMAEYRKLRKILLTYGPDLDAGLTG